MNRPVVYCTNELLYSLAVKYRAILQLKNDGEDCLESWMEGVYELLYEHAEIVIDENRDSIIMYSTDESSSFYNPHLRKLWKNGDRIKPTPQIFRNINIKSALLDQIKSEFLFLNDDINSCEKIRDAKGIFCYGEKELNDLKSWFSAFHMRLNREENNQNPWGFLTKHKHFHNAAIISDNYLLQDPSVIDRNLIPILKNIIPRKLEISYDLAIFVKDQNDLQGKHNYILNALKRISSITINLTIVSTISRYKYHDRKILTNYFWIDVGSGFDRYGKVGHYGNITTHETKITIHPISKVDKTETGKQYYEIHSEMLHDFKQAFNYNPKQTRSGLRVVGSRKHRLLT